MPATVIAPTPSDAPVGQPKKGAASQQAAVPFARSSKWHIEQGNQVSGVTINTAVPGTFNFDIPSYGYLSGVILTVLATGGTGSAAVYFEDAPWSIIQQLQLLDVNGVPLYQLTGYEAFLAAKYGGYRGFTVDGSTTAFGPATPASIGNNPVNFQATTGNFGFVLPIFTEFGRDGLGCLPNMDASARYRLSLQIASATANANTGPVYTTAPTGYPTLAIGIEGLYRSFPPAADLAGNANSITPPAVGTAQYWSRQTASSLSGAQTIQLTRTGNWIRNHILIFRDPSATPTRALAESQDLPSTLEFDWDVAPRYIANLSTFRQLYGFQSYGYDVPKGVVVLPYTTDPDKLAFSEFGDEWMQTVGATKMTLRFTPAANVNLTVLTNDLVPASAQVFAAGALAQSY